MSEALKIDPVVRNVAELESFLHWVQVAVGRRLPALLGQRPEDLKLEFHPSDNSNPKEYWATSILLAAEGLTVRLSLLFRTTALTGVIPTPEGMIQDEIKEFLVDFMKEYCNQTAGFLKTELEKVGVNAAISIPIRYRCLDLIFSKLRYEEIKSTYAATVRGEPCFHLQVGVEVDQDKLEQIKSLQSPADPNAEDVDIELF